MTNRSRYRKSAVGGRRELRGVAVMLSCVLSRWVWSGSGSRVKLSRVSFGLVMFGCVKSSLVRLSRGSRVGFSSVVLSYGAFRRVMLGQVLAVGLSRVKFGPVGSSLVRLSQGSQVSLSYVRLRCVRFWQSRFA